MLRDTPPPSPGHLSSALGHAPTQPFSLPAPTCSPAPPLVGSFDPLPLLRPAPSSFRHPPFPPPPLPLPLLRSTLCARGWPSASPDDEPTPGGGGGGALCVTAEAGGGYGGVWLSPPPQPARLLIQPASIAPGLRSGLRWLQRSGDDPVGCRLMVGCCYPEACTAAVFIGVMRLPGCPFGSAWCTKHAWSVRFVGWANWVDYRCFLSFVFLGVARRLELSPCNTGTPTKQTTANQHNSQTKHQRKGSRITPIRNAAVHTSSTATPRHHYASPAGSSPDPLSQRSPLRSTTVVPHRHHSHQRGHAAPPA